MKFEKNLPLSFDVTIQAMSILFKGEISSDFFQPSQKTSTLLINFALIELSKLFYIR